MIYYSSDRLWLWEILLRWHGSALNGPAPVRAFLMALLALVVAAINNYSPFLTTTSESVAFSDTLTVFNTFVGLIMSFRLNSAFQQWRSGIVALGSLAEAARGLVASGCSYVSTATAFGDVSETPGRKTEKQESAPAVLKDHHLASPSEDTDKSSSPKFSEEEPLTSDNVPLQLLEKCTFFTELRRLTFLYVAIVFHECRGTDGIKKMRESGMLPESEYQELLACGVETPKHAINPLSWDADRAPHKLRATIVELWLKRLVEVAAQRGHLTAPAASAMHGKIAQLPNMFTTVDNIANIPIPFNYIQFIQLLIVGYLCFYTLVIVPGSEFYTPLWVFMWAIFLFAADQVAMEIECPFGLDANDVDLEARLLQIEEELTALVRSQYYFVTGGSKLSRANSTGSWKTLSTPTENMNKNRRPSIQESFSFHQGRFGGKHSQNWSEDAMPDIDQYTSLIINSYQHDSEVSHRAAPGSSSVRRGIYGSVHSL